MPIGQPTMIWGAGALRDLEAPAGSVRVVDRLEMVGHAWGCSHVGAFTVGGTAGAMGVRLVTSAPVGDLDLYLWVNSNPKPIPGSVQVSGTRYPDSQVKYL